MGFFRRRVSGCGGFGETLGIARVLLSGPEDLIHKAVGWMLSEVGARDPEAEEVLLKAHCRRAPRVTLRSAVEKFPEEKGRRHLKGEV